jgi:hypothetical protein
MAMEKFRHRLLQGDASGQAYAYPKDKHPQYVSEVRGGDDIHRP